MTGPTAQPLISLNVGVPRDMEWQGRIVRTGIWGKPVSGARMVRRLNIDRDGQGDLLGHGGVNRAVYVYQLDSYRYWAQQLGRDDFEYGQFGENFTVQELSDNEVCIGDRYGIGDAGFEVSQPRVTCYRVGIRTGNPQMASLLVAHHRHGFYLRVLQEGEVQAGAEIRKLAADPEQMTVAEIDGLLYLPRRSRRQLERALRIPALSEGWEGSFRDLLQQPDGGASGALGGVTPLAWRGFRDMRVVAIDRESVSIISIRLTAADGDSTTPPLPDQFLTLRLRPTAKSVPLLRSYSLSGAPDPSQYRISVKLEPEGAASGFLHTRLRVGDIVQVGAPRGTFVLQDGQRPVVLISAGVGATPVLAMLNALAAAQSDREVWRLHGARNEREQAFRDESARLLSSLANAHRLVCYSNPDPGDKPGNDFDRASRLDGSALDDAGSTARRRILCLRPGRVHV
jgi:MOSC domain-containing protein YiiM/ferredoxin-NADP reductase